MDKSLHEEEVGLNREHPLPDLNVERAFLALYGILVMIHLVTIIEKVKTDLVLLNCTEILTII